MAVMGSNCSENSHPVVNSDTSLRTSASEVPSLSQRLAILNLVGINGFPVVDRSRKPCPTTGTEPSEE